MKIKRFLSKYALRGEGVRSLILLVLLFEVFAFASPFVSFVQRASNQAAVLPAVLGLLTNEERTIQNIGTLTESELLQKAAQLKAEDMAEKGYFAHTSPEGKSPWYWVRLAGYDYTHAGENLAVNFKNSEDVTRAWMNSPSHRDNIIRPIYTEVGTGIAKGIYKGKETEFIAQIYARPAQSVRGGADEAVAQGVGVAVAATTDTRVLGAIDEVMKEPIVQADPIEVSFSDEIATIAIAGVVGLIVVGGALALFSMRHPVITINILAVIAVVGFAGLLGMYTLMPVDPETSHIEYTIKTEYNEYTTQW